MNGITLDQALRKVGGRGRAQWLALMCCGFAVAHSASFLLSLPLILTTPRLYCETETDTIQQCSISQACLKGEKVVFSATEERSVIYEWKLICSLHFYAQLIPTCALLGLAMGCLLTGRLGDSLGRKRCLVWLMLCSCVCQFVLLCSATAVFFAGGLLCAGVFLPATALLPAVLITEVTDKRARGPFLGVLCMFFILGTGSSYVLSYYFLTWRPLLIQSILFSILSFLFLPFLTESPRFFASNLSRFQRTRAVLSSIAARNRNSMFEDKLVGENMNEYDETGANKQADNHKDSKVEVSNEYMGSANNIDEREKELNRGQKCGYLDLVRLKSMRSDWVRMVGLVMVMGVNWGELGSEQGADLEQRYIDRGISLAVSFGIVLAITLTSNFAGRKLLIRLSLFVLGCVGLSRLLLPELSVAVYVQQSSIAGCVLCTVILLQLTLETPATPARCLYLGSVCCMGVVTWSAVRVAILYIPTHSSSVVLLTSNLLGLLSTWKLRETAKKRLNDFIDEFIQLPPPLPEPPSDLKSVPKEQNYNAFNEEVRGLE